MAFSDSMFLFEIIVEEFKSLVDTHDFRILSRFADVFRLVLKDPNKVNITIPKSSKIKRTKHRTKVRVGGTKVGKIFNEPNALVGQSVLVAHNIETLKNNMIQYPLELLLCRKTEPQYIMGSTQIPWSEAYVEYLNDLNKNKDIDPVTVNGRYSVFDEFSSRRMATIKLNVKLTCLKDKFTTQFKSLSEDQNTFMYTGFNSTQTKVLSTIKSNQDRLSNETGTIKTIYAGGKKKIRISKKNKKTIKPIVEVNDLDTASEHNVKLEKNESLPIEPRKSEIHDNIVDLVRSETNLSNKQVDMLKSKSYSSLQYDSHLNTLNYIFGDDGPFGNRVYCVGYFTVQNEFDENTSSKETVNAKSSNKSGEKYKFSICSGECPNKKTTSGPCSPSQCSLDLPIEASHLISVSKCKRIDCDDRKHREPPTPPDSRILIDLSSMKKDCCDTTETVEEVVGGISAKLKLGDEHPCYCSCECTFGFTKKTTYCNICGGYELPGEEMARKPGVQMPFPCPVFHKLMDKNRKTYSSGSDSKKRAEDSQRTIKGGGSGKDKRALSLAGAGAGASDKGGDKSAESEKDNKKGKKKKKDDRFKFNYGYQGIPPQIGHSQCALPCTGTLGAVPKNMGWLWTADNVPGLKFRPFWKPGAANKHVVRMLRFAKNPGEIISKKRRKEGVKKRPLKRPLIVVSKKDGEYTVTMETMKSYTKQRAINQQPYEEKPLVTYTIGRSEEENRERRKKKERVARRLERAQREFIQCAFKDMCKDICVKTYQQALGILPDTEDPECTCYPAEPGPDRTNLNLSCSCSEASGSLGSDTDSDEWILEFTPPNAYFDPTIKIKKVGKVDNSSQYTYLDYKVKLPDRYGVPVPRFFKGPDGKQQCSDLGGFWSPDHKWLEINIDGYVAPDDRWAPMMFFGPNGETVETETGTFQAANGKWLEVGIHGYIDCNGKWRFYPRPRVSPSQKKKSPQGTKKDKDVKKGAKKDDKTLDVKISEANWSCFGDTSPKELSKLGIVGHGMDRKLLLATLKQMLSYGEDVKLPQPSVVPRRPETKKGKKARFPKGEVFDTRKYFTERTECRHPVPSEKGILAVDSRGNKTYFKLKDYKNRRPKERIINLTEQGISLSSFHVPCFHSFINSEIMKQQQRDRLLAMAAPGRTVATQA